MQRDGLSEYAVVYLKGLAMGTADALPGVSGGTIALITGIYERLITALTSLDPNVLMRLADIHRGEGRRAFWRDLVEMDVPFLLLLGTGMVTAVIVLSDIVQEALAVARGPTFAFFFGLIAASAVVLYRDVEIETVGQAASAVAGFVLAFLVSGAAASGGLPTTVPAVFLTGMIAISAMILPGVSGSLLLVLLGQYDYMTHQLETFVHSLVGLVTGGSTTALAETGTTVVVFMGGAFVGVFTFAYGVKWALSNYRRSTLAFLVSLMAGALRKPGIEIVNATDAWTPTTTSVLVVAGVVGAVAVLLLDYYTDDLDY